MDENVINHAITFCYRGNKHNALVYKITDNGELLCFYLLIKEQAGGKNTCSDYKKWDLIYCIEYPRRFKLPALEYKILFKYPDDLVEEAKQKAAQIEPLSDLLDKQKKLKDQLKALSQRESKAIRREYNLITKKINERDVSVLFMNEDNIDYSDKYRNYRAVPDEKGIRKVFQGGGCAKK